LGKFEWDIGVVVDTCGEWLNLFLILLLIVIFYDFFINIDCYHFILKHHKKQKCNSILHVKEFVSVISTLLLTNFLFNKKVCTQGK
jgi:hypothetical protein